MHCWLDNDDACVLVEDWCERTYIRIVLFAPEYGHRKRRCGDFRLIEPEGVAVGRAVIRGDCPAGVLADWLEEHSECALKVFDHSDPVEECVRLTIEWLRKMVSHSLVE